MKLMKRSEKTQSILQPSLYEGYYDMKKIVKLCAGGLMITMLLTACSAKPSEQEVKKFVLQQLDNMAFVKQGSFLMGPGKKEHQWASGNNQPQQSVTLSSYYMAKYLVTWGNYDFYTTSNNLPRLVKEGYKYKMFWRSPQHPATNMNWQSASNYCHYLANKSGLPFALPTEAQWEYAARNRGQDVDDATNTGTSIYGKNTPDAQQLENQPGHVDDSPFPMTVGKFPPNPLGLYGMTGSVFQWVKNWFYPYSTKPVTDPQGTKTGTEKATRGGGDDVASPGFAGIYIRAALKPDYVGEDVGFRCAINSAKPMSELKAIAMKHLS